MIQSFEINNFRCFHSTKATGFTRINLLGGKNNAGKTALLEALYLMGNPSNLTINNILRLRNINPDKMKEFPETAWNNFFYQQDNSIEITIDFILDKKKGTVLITCDEIIDDYVDYVENEKDTQGKEILDFVKTLSDTEKIKSSLHINSNFNNKVQSNVYVSNTNGIKGTNNSNGNININFIPANAKRSVRLLTTDFAKAKLSGNYPLLLKAFRIIDKDIESIETLKTDEANLYVTRKGEKPLQLSLFGDAMNKITDYILQIVNNKNCILLLDEIENGIHYENQEEIWEILFELAEMNNVQIFATTHSKEMIEAFKNIIIKNNYQDSGSYFEMLRHRISNEILIEKMPIYLLQDRIEKQEPIRGEDSNKRKA